MALLILGLHYQDIKNWCEQHNYNPRSNDIVYATLDSIDKIYGVEITSLISLPGITHEMFLHGVSRMRWPK